MKIKLNFPASKTEKRQKPNPNDLFRSYLSCGCTSRGVYSGYYDKEFAYGFVYHKINRKVKSKKRITKEWDGKQVKTFKYTYEPAKWVVSYYKIPFTILEFAKLELRQYSRHFELVPKKR